ncbi:diguanylate cyclase [Brevundimonas sp.]|uniref:diguanylate cyclase n=2 Tax=unclassified Brevundimonas TaxID=2622653 RepID=UPI0028A1983E|nr:diguanylate cyclase [Brevundimonas sp.]
MLNSLTSRIAALGIMIFVSILLLVLGVADASRKTQESFRWVMHSGMVLRNMDATMAGLRSAESAQRGYVLTRNSTFESTYEVELAQAHESLAKVRELTQDNPFQQDRIQAIGNLFDEWNSHSQKVISAARASDFERATDLIKSGSGLASMTELEVKANEFVGAERTLQSTRVELAQRRLHTVRSLALVGGPLIAIFSALVSVLIIYGIRRPISILDDAMTRFGAGDYSQRTHTRMGSREFARLAKGYNGMAESITRSASESQARKHELQAVHEELLTSARALSDRNDVIELLGAMSHRMQATRSDTELAEVISIFVPRVLPGLPGALYAFDQKRERLVAISRWGEVSFLVESFLQDECWALRRGQSHWISGVGKDVTCAHAPDRTVYHCEPLLAAGEVIGVLHLDGLLDEEQKFRMTMLTENIASAMVNRRLQDNLKEQTIRDPLTGLFNRRYMQEALSLEIARAARAKSPLCVVMCDVDHFKRFNDQKGHDAGDTVLKAVAATLEEKFRDGDIVCRYGGEEFTIIAPGTRQEDLLRRTEAVRLAIAAAEPELRGEPLGKITMSFGIAEWIPNMDRTGDALLAAADKALYEAKHAGRNRIVGHTA